MFLDRYSHLHCQTMEEKYGVPFCSWVQQCTGKSYTLIFFIFFCHIYRTTISWDPPEILLPWQHDIMTSPLYHSAVVATKTGILKEFRNQNLIIILLYWSVQKENQQKGRSLDKYCVINLQKCFMKFKTWGGKFQNLWSTKTDVNLFLLALII